MKVVIEQTGALTRVVIEGHAHDFNETQLEAFIEALAYEAERVSKESRAVYELPDEAEETEPEGPTVR